MTLSQLVQSRAFHPSVRKLWNGTDETEPAPPRWLGFHPVVANLAGMRLCGSGPVAGAVVRVETRTGIEWWVVIARGRCARTAEWAVALLGEGEAQPWSDTEPACPT